MNQNDYKEISGIIYPYANTPLIRATIKGLAERLADYFERKENRSKRIMGEKGFIRNKMINYEDVFDKQQFLKDCGAEK